MIFSDCFLNSFECQLEVLFRYILVLELLPEIIYGFWYAWVSVDVEFAILREFLE